VLDAPFEPKPLQQPRLPLLVGGSGPRMLRLTARHADIWNMVGTPEEVEASNRRLDEACAAEGRDPATLVRSVSPRLNLLASADAFAEGVAAYRAAGMQDIYLPWPRTEAELPVLREVARDILPGLRGVPPAPAEPTAKSRLRQPGSGDESLLAQIVAGLGDSPAQRLLDFLIAHPDDRFDEAALATHLGLARHDEVTRAVMALAAAFAKHGLSRPWDEAQSGYLLSGERAALFTR
jgi:alkanesulfonate monooxygenase SsuD/methylene tetrahydromethanopterin reductase-like flavin-dependent oxidoreductase (luciferase family)